jgi:hypothetical protein
MPAFPTLVQIDAVTNLSILNISMVITATFFVIFPFIAMFNTIVGAGAGAASRYGFGFDQKMRLYAGPARQHWFLRNTFPPDF